MPEERITHVQLELSKGYEITASFPDFPQARRLVMDEPAPLGESKGPNAAAVLGAAIGDCLGASLLFCMRKARAVPESLTVDVKTHIVRNEAGRFRIAAIDVELDPGVHHEDANRFVRCEELFEDFCIVTASVRQGIPVNVTVKKVEAV